MVLGNPKSRSSLASDSGPESSTPSGAPAGRGFRGALVIVALITFLFALVGLNVRATYGAQVTSDEPQYLLTALSLAEDADLDISDELVDGRFLDFHEVPLNPQTLDLTESGQRLSPHDPGLPLLLAGPMRLGGWRLAKVALAVVAAVTAALTAWVAVRRFGVGVGTASIVVCGFFVAPPLTSYATQIYPEMPAALLVMVGLAALTGRTAAPYTAGRLVAFAVSAIVLLPWLSIKYAPLSVVLAMALGGNLLRDRRSGLRTATTTAVIGCGVLVLSGVVYLVVHQRVYGGWTVYAAGDHFVDGEFQVVGVDPDYLGRTQRLTALLLDRSYGLAAWAPAYLLAVPALGFVVRSRRPGTGTAIGVVAAGWAVATWLALTMHGWWWPGRQVVVILPVVAIVVAQYVEHRPKVLVGFVAASTLSTVNWLWLAIEASTGRRTLIVDFFETDSPLYRLWSPLLPDYRVFAGRDLALTCIWTAVLLLLVWVGSRQAAAATSS